MNAHHVTILITKHTIATAFASLHDDMWIYYQFAMRVQEADDIEDITPFTEDTQMFHGSNTNDIMYFDINVFV